jgi:hypothetical protein
MTDEKSKLNTGLAGGACQSQLGNPDISARQKELYWEDYSESIKTPYWAYLAYIGRRPGSRGCLSINKCRGKGY